MPAPAARIGVSAGIARSMPACIAPQRIPKQEVTAAPGIGFTQATGFRLAVGLAAFAVLLRLGVAVGGAVGAAAVGVGLTVAVGVGVATSRADRSARCAAADRADSCAAAET
ncbi:hypothetical protein Pen02_44870 [Plantactinospora endophytica]|uniref:Uncharacterized protein n=1 Tax=Plantactinospora endophytica TaxID=673535 RepID=A0ABQ4E5E8_9ACTN|nr:hypothetical protein Pen02_44870 [Plantactinospora endophytica]